MTGNNENRSECLQDRDESTVVPFLHPDKNEQHQHKDDIDKVNKNSININSIVFDSQSSVLTASLNTSSG